MKTIKDICELFKVDRSTVRRWWRNREIPVPMTKGRRKYWTDEEYEALARRHRGR